MDHHQGLPLPAAQLRLALSRSWKSIAQLSTETGLPPVTVRQWGIWLVKQGHAMGQKDRQGAATAFCLPIPDWAYNAMFGEPSA